MFQLKTQIYYEDFIERKEQSNFKLQSWYIQTMHSYLNIVTLVYLPDEAL